MSEYNKTVLTNQGIALMKKANEGTAKFKLTKGASSTENLTDKTVEELQNLTELPSVMQYVSISKMEQNDDTVIGVSLNFDNKDLINSYAINTIGLYAQEDGSDAEILYAITTAKDAEKLPDFKNKVLYKFKFLMYVYIGRAENVTVNVTEDGTVSSKDFEKYKTEVSRQIKETGKVKTVDKQAPDANGDINLGLNAKYSALDGRIAALENKPDPIKVFTNETDAENYSKAHPEVVVIVKEA